MNNYYSYSLCKNYRDEFCYNSYLNITGPRSPEGSRADIREAARINGANKFQEYFKIVIPMQKPATLTVLIILLMYSLKVFDLVYLLTGGGPGRSSEVLSTLMYEVTFNRNLFGQGAAIGIVMFVISMIIILPFFIRRRGSYYK